MTDGGSVKTAAGAVLVCFAVSGAASAAPFSLVSLNTNPGGQSAEQSAQDWAEWVGSFDQVADGGNPVDDETGEFQTRNQAYPVHLLGGGPATGVERSFRVSPGEVFFMPLLNVTCVGPSGDFSCADPDVAGFVESIVDGVDSLSLTIDGASLIYATTASEVDALESEHRIDTGLFPLEITADNNWYGEAAGIYAESQNTGFFAAFTLDRGIHTVEFGGANSEIGFANSVSARIAVIPLPATFGFLAFATSLLAGVGSLRSRSTV